MHSVSRGGGTGIGSLSSSSSLEPSSSSLNSLMPGLGCSSAGSGGVGGAGLHYLNDLSDAVHGTQAAAAGTLETGVDNIAPMHSSLNNNNNMVSAGPSPSSSISPLHSAACVTSADLSIPHTSVALAAAAAAAVSSMASIEAMGFIDQQQHAKLDKGANAGSEGSPKYISL